MSIEPQLLEYLLGMGRMLCTMDVRCPETSRTGERVYPLIAKHPNMSRNPDDVIILIGVSVEQMSRVFPEVVVDELATSLL